ncbi:hypothetical protein N4P55_06550 [Pseudomonas fluorescens]|uniref:hypothetical protein n=1 Tax=Pseudomonas fluorescens TaxID=294 RepID=UPI0021CE6728|nr:hypothetical protein [Pseudomonas fluorescens]UXV21011.1 hypothetical protein N4P55_06550 [Pseudomonas fluorescens]
MPEEKLIEPAEVVRDEHGYWYHSDIPDFDEDAEAWKAWLAVQGLTAVGWHMDSDLDSHPYWEDGEAHCLGWEPETPQAYNWFLLGIFDTDDGPYVQWATREVQL